MITRPSPFHLLDTGWGSSCNNNPTEVLLPPGKRCTWFSWRNWSMNMVGHTAALCISECLDSWVPQVKRNKSHKGNRLARAVVAWDSSTFKQVLCLFFHPSSSAEYAEQKVTAKNTFGLTRATASRCKARQRANFFLPCYSRSKVDNSGINPKGPGMAFWAQHPQQPVWPRKKNEKFITKLHPSPSHAPMFSSHLTLCALFTLHSPIPPILQTA